MIRMFEHGHLNTYLKKNPCSYATIFKFNVQ